MATVRFKEFTGLLQSITTRRLRSTNELTRAINIVGDKTGGLQKRLGYSRYSATVEAAQNLQGLHAYYRLNGDATLLAVANGTLYRESAGAWIAISGGLLTDTRTEMATFLDEVFICAYNSTTRTFDTIRNLDALALTTTNNLASAPNAKIPIVFRQRLCLISVTGRRSAFRYSSVPADSGTTITWPAANVEEVRTDDGEELIGASNLANRLVLFKDNSMHEWNETVITQVAQIGTTSHRSIVNIGNGALYFFSRSKNIKGFYKYEGGQPKLISGKIQEWCDGITNTTLADIVGFRLGKNIIWYVGTITLITELGTETFTNSALVYNMPNNVWSHFQYDDTFRVYSPFIVSSVERPYLGASDGDVHQIAISGDTVYTDNGTAIAALFRTNKIDFEVEEDKKRISRSKWFSEIAQGVQMRVRGDSNNNWENVGMLTKNVNEFGSLSTKGHYFEFEGSESSANPPFIFESFVVSATTDTKFD